MKGFVVLMQVDMPRAYVCADSKIYEASQWYICQGMRCPANTHKPSFHVNMNATAAKRGTSGSSGQKGNQRMPNTNPDETMTEEEFYEWLQNAVQSGMFDNARENPSSATASSTSSSSSKKKKKGKKQW
jgi:DnaJ family protein C protein 14